DLGRWLRAIMGVCRPGELVADCADGDSVTTGLEPAFGKDIASGGVAGHARRYNRVVLARGDDDALHGALGLRSDLAGQGCRSTFVRGERRRTDRQSQRGRHAKDASEFHGTLPKNKIVVLSATRANWRA